MEAAYQSTYKIKMDSFEGPFGLLLDLIERKKLFISDLSLGEVTDDFLSYVKETGKLHLGEGASFLSVAATLILIKSKSLLPDLNLTSEEEKNISNLEERLRMYEEFRKLSLGIKDRFGAKVIYPPLERKNTFLVFLPDKEITRDNMMRLARAVLSEIPKAEELPEVPVKKIVSIEEMIDRLISRINQSLKLNFTDFTRSGDAKEVKIATIVGFLAMLELVRQGLLEARQENHSDDIIIERAGNGVQAQTLE
jgi:segregation and condensation protein A